VETNGVRHTAVAIGRLLRGFFYADGRLIVEPWRRGELQVRELGPEQMPALAELNRKRGRPEIQRLFAEYLGHGFHAFVAYLGGELVGYYWWVDRNIPRRYTDLHKLGLEIELGEQDVYGSHFFLIEEHRGGGVAADFLFDVESSLRDRGFTRLWGYVAGGNRPARWVYSTRGYKPTWVIRLRRILLMQRTTRESL
jgi:GNAT superfamily N-acetyltransferase